MERYQRQINLDEIGESGQKKLLNSHVLVVGAGGLGCPALLYLAAAGVGYISIIDHDSISETNLNRQVLYTPNDIGKLKVDVAKKKLEEQNSLVKIKTFSTELNLENAKEIISKMEVVLDCTDNMATRYLLSDICEILKVPLVYAGVHRFQGQLTVFHKNNKIAYRDLFPYEAGKISPSSCDENGVLGIVPGILGTLQANETIKIIAGFGDVMDGKMMVLNLLNLQSQIFSIKKTKRNRINELIERPEYEHLCVSSNNCISVSQFLDMDYKNLDLIDIREKHELPKSNLPPTLESEISKKDIVLLCLTGQRTKVALQKWMVKYPSKNIYSLNGGVMALNKKLT